MSTHHLPAQSSRDATPLRVGYLFVGPRRQAFERVLRGENHGAGFWGLCHLGPFGIDAEFIDLEEVYPLWFCRLVRRHVSAYWLHLFIFWKLFAYDVMFASTGFGTQLVFSLLPGRRPKWVMHDFTITGFLGNESTLRQKLFAFLVGRCAGIVTLSEKEAELLKRRFPHLAHAIAWIPFGADTSFFVPTDCTKERSLLAVGTDPDRDYRTLFAACEGLDLPLVVTTRPNRLAPFNPLPSFVAVKSYTPKELVEAYDRAGIVIIPLDTSRRLNDAMGCSTVHEAMTMGKAIIATRTFTMESYITHEETGLLVEEGNVEEMRAALQRLLNDAELRERLARNARAFALKHLEITKCTHTLATFFEKIARTPKQS